MEEILIIPRIPFIHTKRPKCVEDLSPKVVTLMALEIRPTTNEQYKQKLLLIKSEFEKRQDRLKNQIDKLDNLFMSDFVVKAPKQTIVEKYINLYIMREEYELIPKIIFRINIQLLVLDYLSKIKIIKR